MRCAKCGTENRAGRRFCSQCGERLVCCPSCGAQNEAGEFFCGDCGTALASDTPSSGAGPLAEPEIRVSADRPASLTVDGERKTVTALFADLKGSTELMRDLDPEVARAQGQYTNSARLDCDE